MPAPHILYMPPAGHEAVVKGLSYQSRIDLNFSMQALFVGVKDNDLVFSRNDGSRLVLEGYLNPASPTPQSAASSPVYAQAALLAASPPAIIVNGKEMSPAHFFSSLGEEGMPQVDTWTDRKTAYQDYEHSELQGGISSLGGRIFEEALTVPGKAKTDTDDGALQNALGADALSAGMGSPYGGQSGTGGTGGTGTDPGGSGTGTDPGNPAGAGPSPNVVPAQASMTETTPT